MAPIARRSSLDDDFVLTISDDDQDIPLLDEEEDPTIESYIKRSPNGKKRKRDAVEHTSANITTTNGTDKAAKKRKQGKTVPEAGITSEPEDQTWAAQGESDGAMDSDFEFQIGDADTGVLEDFDGWGLDASKMDTKGEGNIRGVDIDELIARRRGVAVGRNGIDIQGSEGNNKGSQGGLEDSEGDEEELNSDADGFIATDEEDETLAEDGFGMGATDTDEEAGHTRGTGDDQDSDGTSDNSSIAEPVPHPDDQDQNSSSADDGDDPEEHARREAFFAPEEKVEKSKAKNLSSNSFQRMQLSRPILRGLATVGFSEPTPIQSKTIPVALLGKDVVGGAVTGSGKTAAFIIPILERLLYRPKKVPTSRVAILMPTRELAVQCFNVGKKLASFTDVTFCQLVGGFSLREQESVLRNRPDVIIATPGRFIDHMRNSASFTVDTLEILILDEADRMLEDGFADELDEILTTIPRSRQTMLFSATMTDKVDKLIRVGLNRPVRLMVDARKQTVGTLVQEFVRLRPGREDKRLGYLMYLCHNVYTERVLIFFRKKSDAHRVRIVFGLCGLKAAELHGSMSQEQRIASVEAFRSSSVSFLLATDVASRGLDIKNISTVINYEAPQSHEIYLHRVGRTARAGRTGRSCTIAAEPDRKVVKAAVKAGKAQGAKIVSRVVDVAEADSWAQKVDAMTESIEEILKDEKEEKQLSSAQMQLQKGENIIDHQDEILSRPKRTWFESEKEKRAAKKTGRVELNGAGEDGGKKKAKAGKLSGKEKKRLDDGRERVEGRVWKKGKEERGAKVVKGAGEKGRKKEKGGKDTREGGRGGRGGGRGGARGGRAGGKR